MKNDSNLFHIVDSKPQAEQEMKRKRSFRYHFHIDAFNDEINMNKFKRTHNQLMKIFMQVSDSDDDEGDLTF